ncbi:MAG TPA: YheU family protein [Polyangiales bacterium]|nr:YheU family protein [Polyangiales bacterium]
MSESEAEVDAPVEVPASALSPQALRGLVEEFITREGTDYGVREHTFDEKRDSVLRLIAAGEVLIFFDPASETTTLRRRADL